MGLYSVGLIIGRICASEIWGAYLREGFFWGGGWGLLSEFYGIHYKVTVLFLLQHVTSVFGAERCMFGSDWPVCTLARDASYKQTFEAYLQCVLHLSDQDKQAVFCDNVVKFYGLGNS